MLLQNNNSLQVHFGKQPVIMPSPERTSWQDLIMTSTIIIIQSNCGFNYTGIYLEDICEWLLDFKRPSNPKIVSALVWYIWTMFTPQSDQTKLVMIKKQNKTWCWWWCRGFWSARIVNCAACRLERAAVQHWLLSSLVTTGACGRVPKSLKWLQQNHSDFCQINQKK